MNTYGERKRYIWILWISIVLLLSGCSGLKRIEINPEERNLLRNQPKIVAVHYQTLSPLPVYKVAYEHDYHLATGHPLNSIPMEDPVRRVKERFLHVLSQDLGLNNIRPVDEARFSEHIPALGADVYPLRRIFGHRMVIDFETINWSLPFVAFYSFRSSLDPGQRVYRLNYEVRVRLIRLDDSMILWQGICHFEDPAKPLKLEKLTKDDNALLIAKRLEAADACADQLLDQFFGSNRRPHPRAENGGIKK